MNKNVDFKSLGLDPRLIKRLTELEIIHPTAIQEKVLPVLLSGDGDLVGQAQTGTGKTAAFGLPLLEKINPKSKTVQGLILCPTRELGQQVAKQLFWFTKYYDQIFTEAVYGGAKIDKQIERLQRPTHIIVATPGRLIDLVKRKAVDLSNVKTIILDEADEMLSMGFKKELDQIFDFLPAVENKWLFSATMPHGIRNIVNTHLRKDALRVTTQAGSVVNKNIRHQFVVCDDKEKLPIAVQFIKSQGDARGVVFCKTKSATQKLEKQLQARNFEAAAIHGDLLQQERDKVMRAFKKENLRILAATDIAARGIDIRDLKYVLQYQLPSKEEYYTHRSGRTARAGNSGLSLCLVNTKEIKQLRFLEKKLNIVFNQVRA
jgi:ATP-dependent RNA helicase DeaD